MSTGRTSLVAPSVKNLSAVQETWVQSQGWDADLEKEMATHSTSCLENPRDGGEESDMTEGLLAKSFKASKF